MSDTFPAAVVKELRGRADRYRKRVRFLEVALIRARLEIEGASTAKSVFSLPDHILEGIHVDDDCVVHGLAPAIAFLNS